MLANELLLTERLARELAEIELRRREDLARWYAELHALVGEAQRKPAFHPSELDELAERWASYGR